MTGGSPGTGRGRSTPVSGSTSVGTSPLGLPGWAEACLFDLDGVLTQTASIHAAAWKEMFDDYLSLRTHQDETTRPFDLVGDYDAFVDGRPRADGTRAFLAARGIELPEGDPDDPPGAETVSGLCNQKNEILLHRIGTDGVRAYQGSVRFVRAARDLGLRRAVVSSSTNCADVLVAAGIEDLFEERVDGLTAIRDHLAGKPAPDMFLAAARALGIPPRCAVVFEDALAGVAAGRAGGFGLVIGVDRTGQARELEAHGADLVVTDLAELLADG
jgi:beta-phosphoglucomutase family hydrolase